MACVEVSLQFPLLAHISGGTINGLHPIPIQISTSAERQCANLGNVLTQLDRSVATAQRDFDWMEAIVSVGTCSLLCVGRAFSLVGLACHLGDMQAIILFASRVVPYVVE